MIKILVAVFTLSMLALTSSAMAVGTLEDGMTELAQQIVKNSVAKGKKSIAISSFQHINGDQSELSNYLSDELVLKLFSVPGANLEIIERGQLNKIFQEMQFNMTGVVDSKTIQQLGKLHGVGALVLGSITEMGESIRVNARLIDTETGRVFSAAGTTISKTATIAELLSRIILVADHGGSKKSFNSSGAISKKSSRSGNPQIYKLDLKQYDIGDMPEELGFVTVEKGHKIVGKRVLKGFQGGGFEFEIPKLKNNFEISFLDYNLTEGENSIYLISESENNLKWKLSWPSKVYVGESTKYLYMKNYSANSKPNRFRIVSKGRVVKFFVNDDFIGSQIHDSNTIYTKFKITLTKQANEIADIKFTQK